MFKKMKKQCKMVSESGDLLTRIVLGLIFLMAGYGKLFASPGIDGFTGMLSGIGIPAASFFAILVGVIELVGGLMLVLGIFVEIPSALLLIIMAVAIVTVHLKDGWNGFRYPLLLAVLLVRYMGGVGKCGLQKHVNKMLGK